MWMQLTRHYWAMCPVIGYCEDARQSHLYFCTASENIFQYFRVLPLFRLWCHKWPVSRSTMVANEHLRRKKVTEPGISKFTQTHRQVHTHLDNSCRTWCIEFYDIRCRQIKSPGPWRSSYLHNGISYTGKMSSLYWIRPKSPRLWEAVVRDVYSSYKKDFIWSWMYQVNYVFVRYLSTTVHGISLIQLCYP